MAGLSMELATGSPIVDWGVMGEPAPMSTADRVFVMARPNLPPRMAGCAGRAGEGGGAPLRGKSLSTHDWRH